MKTYRYPNTKEWKIAGIVIVTSMILIILTHIKFQDMRITVFFIVIMGLASARGIYSQYKRYNQLMEIIVDSNRIVAKRWGGISNYLEMEIDEIENVTPFNIDNYRKGLKITKGAECIYIGDSIQNFQEIMSLLKSKGFLE